MKRILFLFILSLLLLPSRLYAGYDAYSNWCQQGAQHVSLQGLTSTTYVQRSYPSCTVTVYLYGTGTLATLYTNPTGSSLTNPFTANSSGQLQFYAASGYYDVVFSGASMSSPLTISHVQVGSYTTGTATVGLLTTIANCSDNSGSIDCGAAPTGAFIVAASATTATVNTTAVTAASRIFLQDDRSLFGSCNAQGVAVLGLPEVSARSAGVSFTIVTPVAPTTTPRCLSYLIVN